MTKADPDSPKLGAIAVVFHDGRFLLVKRKNAPNADTWGFPGGHVDLG
ncbi:MAG: NUDIX domain-containing protein, partial [Pseudomonadota bacterium]